MLHRKTALVFALAGLAASPFAFAQEHDRHRHGATASEHNSPVQLDQQTVYTCSMHPHIRSTDPTERCPICGMALIPVADDHAHSTTGAPVLSLGPRALALVSVSTQPVSRRTLDRELHLNGKLVYDQTRIKTLSAWMPGRLDRVYVDYLGASVRQGDRLADIYSPELVTAQAELLRARRLSSAGDTGTLRAARTRLRLLGLSDEQITDIERHGELREQLPIRATLSGTVLERRAIEGAYVNTGDPLYTIADLSQLWAELEVYETDLPGLAPGLAVRLSSPALSGQTLTGQLLFIEPSIDPLRRTARIRVALPNPDGQLKPGMLVRAQVHLPQPPQLLIPASAPLFTGPRSLVYVRDPDNEGQFSPREVTLGPRVSNHYPVLTGLEEGELVVSQGAFRLDSELQIRGLPSMMAPEGGAAPAHDHGTAVPPPSTPSAPTPLAAEFRQQPWAALYRHYLAAQDALAHDDFPGWQAATQALQGVVDTLHWPDSLQAQRTQLLTGAGHIEHVAGLDDAQNLFFPHSEAMIHLARLGLAPKTSYVFFCPMARADQGAHWLQADNALRNPYFGSMMYRCGELRDTLPSAGGAHD